jgi:O-antigen/teichoic acid export membrane protein
MFLITLPAGVGVAAIARPVMHLVFGSQWDAAVPLVQIFAAVGTFRVIAAISGLLLMVDGVPQIGFRIELASVILRLTGLLVLVPLLGLMGAALTVGVCVLLEEAIYLVVTFGRFHLRAVLLLHHAWRPLLATAVMEAVLVLDGALRWDMEGQTSFDLGLRVGGMVGLGVVAYGVTLLLAWIAAGRPQGAETYLLSTVRRAMRTGRG